jgi:alkylation response protein AidB-like acyl-CoA dehydrogenase
MTQTVSDIREDLRHATRDVMTAHAGRAARRRFVDDHAAYDTTLWRVLATQLGAQGVIIEEEYGGAGATLAELAVVLEEAGAALLCAPLLASAVLATTAIQRAADRAAAADLLPSLADGTRIATLAYTGQPGNALTAAHTADGWRVAGTAVHVLDGAVADTVLVIADTRAGSALFAVDAAQTRRHDQPLLDPTRRLALVAFRGASSRLIGEPGAGEQILSDTLDVARLMLAAEQVGAAQQCLNMTVEYACTRKQFGRAIGSFQAVKHRLADMYVAVQSARAVTEETIAAYLADPQSASTALRTAAALVSDAFLTVTTSALQVHGGIGYTWEHDAHLYLKRALSSARLLGTPTEHRDAVATGLGL